MAPQPDNILPKALNILTVLVSIIAVCIAGVALIPAFGQWLYPHEQIRSATSTPPATSVPPSAPPGITGTASRSRFPLPGNVSNYIEGTNGQVNFQTDEGLKDTIAFYRDAFVKRGLTERRSLTVITNTTFTLVFDGDPNGQAIVIQGVDLGDGTTNVNISYQNF